MQYNIRQMKVEEYSLLEEFLYEAIYVPEGAKTPPRYVTALPELQVYISEFGSEPDDIALVAEVEGKTVGAVWVRIMNDYSHIDSMTPSLAISLYPEYRGLGIGTDMMKKMLCILKERGYRQTSLSVDKTNYALKLYQRLGYQIINENNEDYIMLKVLS